MCLLPGQSAIVPVKVSARECTANSVLLEYDQGIAEATCLRIPNALLVPTTTDGHAQLLVSNPSGFTHSVDLDTPLGEATGVDVIASEEQDITRASLVTTVDGNESIDLGVCHAFHISRELRDNCRKKITQ